MPKRTIGNQSKKKDEIEFPVSEEKSSFSMETANSNQKAKRRDDGVKKRKEKASSSKTQKDVAEKSVEGSLGKDRTPEVSSRANPSNIPFEIIYPGEERSQEKEAVIAKAEDNTSDVQEKAASTEELKEVVDAWKTAEPTIGDEIVSTTENENTEQKLALMSDNEKEDSSLTDSSIQLEEETQQDDLNPSSPIPNSYVQHDGANSKLDEMHQLEHVLNVPTKDATPFDSNLPVFLEIHKGNIYHYFSTAIIAPSKYYTNRAFSDMQSFDLNQVVLANTPSLSDHEENVLLQLELEDSEIAKLLSHGLFSLMDFPVPITRVKAIYVRNNTVRDNIINDSILFNGGFIPESLLKVNFPLSGQKFDLSSVVDSRPSINYTKKLAKFNSILGLFAFLRNYSYLICSRTGVYKTLPDHFFLAMQAIDNEFGSDIVNNKSLSEFYSFLFDENCPDNKKLLQWIFTRINIGENFNDDDVRDFAEVYNNLRDESVPYDKIRKIFSSLTNALERKNALKAIDGLKSKSTLPLYIFAYLRNYGNLNSIEISRRDISSVYSSLLGEYAFAALGYFYGYAALKNTDERQTTDSVTIKSSSEVSTKPAIKFKMDSEFDHAVIELVFNKVFGGYLRRLSNFQGSNIEDSHRLSQELGSEISVQKYALIGITYEKITARSLTPKKENPYDVLSTLPENIPYKSEFGFLCQKLGMTPRAPSTHANVYSMNMMELLSCSTFLKSELMSSLRNPKSRINEEELESRILLARKYKEV